MSHPSPDTTLEAPGLPVRPYVGRAHDHKRLDWLGSMELSVLLDGAASGGRLMVVEVRAQRGDASPVHVHGEEDETFVVLEGGKLTSIDQSGQPSINSKVAIQSDPVGADIIMDGQMVGQTPSTFDVPPGDHQINVQLAGYQDWVRRVHVLAGSTINLGAKLEKK